MTHLDLSLDLEQLIHSDTLPQKLRDEARTLHDRLQAPVRVMITGATQANKFGLLQALLKQKLPHCPAASMHIRHGSSISASYTYDTGETLLRGTMRPPARIPEAATLQRVEVTLPSAMLQDLSFLLPTPAEEQAMRLQHPGAGLPDLADMVLWCTDAFTGAEATQWRALPDALKDHSFLVYLTSLRPLLRGRLARLRAAGRNEFFRLDTVDLRRPKDTGADTLMVELRKLARDGKAAEMDAATVFIETYHAYLPPPGAPPQSETVVESEAQHEDAGETLTEDKAALRAVYAEALDLVRSEARALVEPLPTDSDADTRRVLEICAETAERVAALFDAQNDPDPTFCFVKEEVLSTADRLLLMSMESGLGPAIDAATTLLQMRRDFDFQIAAISTARFTRSKVISPIDEPGRMQTAVA